MKKLICTTLAVLMLLSLSACAGNETPQSNSQTPSSSQSAQSEPQSSTPDPEPSISSEPATPVETSVPFDLSKVTEAAYSLGVERTETGVTLTVHDDNLAKLYTVDKHLFIDWRIDTIDSAGGFTPISGAEGSFSGDTFSMEELTIWEMRGYETEVVVDFEAKNVNLTITRIDDSAEGFWDKGKFRVIIMATYGEERSENIDIRED